MKIGKIKYIIVIVFSFLFLSTSHANEKITTVPLINLEELKPSFEEIEEDTNPEENSNKNVIQKKQEKNKSNSRSVIILGLDKITAKTSKINIKIGETKKFGMLEIKAIKCGKTQSDNEAGEAAYLQVVDLSDTQNEKVFVFNGWTFSSSPSLRPVEHPVYDLWLIGCENV
tara:strand:- start:510 stop:1022 length:513 start_codon:yes stop_codon:yes gene_type:complete